MHCTCEGVHQPWVYVHSSICEASWVLWCIMDVWLILGGSVCHGYICILLYVKLIGCTGVAEIYGHLELGGPSDIGICAFYIYTSSFPYKCHCYCVILLFIPDCSCTNRDE